MSEARSVRSTVVLVEDDPHARARLAEAIRARADLELLGDAATCAEARALLAEAAPNVLLTDLGLPDGNGIELIREARERDSRTLSMVVTVFGDEQSVVRSLEAGASGYLLKDGASEYIGESIAQLLAGGSPISPQIARYLLRRFQEPSAGPGEASPSRVETPPGAPRLTGRETEILRLIAKGFSFPEIADLLEISSHTVTTHVRHIYEKLEVRSRGAAVYEAVNLGIIRMDD